MTRHRLIVWIDRVTFILACVFIAAATVAVVGWFAAALAEINICERGC